MRRADVDAFSAYLREHVTRLPPDLLWRDWVAARAKSQGRRQLVYRRNMLEHIGAVSTFAVRPEARACARERRGPFAWAPR